VLAVVQRDTIQSGPALSGSLAPEREAALRAEVGGTVTAALVEPGQPVRAGQVLARIETGGLNEQVLSARSAVTSAELAYETAQRNAERSDRLLQAGAIAARDAETARTQASAARAQLETARAQLAAAQRQLRNTEVTAPFSGVVGTKTVSRGDVVAPGAALYTVVDPSSMRLEASVPAEQLAQVRVGAPVAFTVNGYPGRRFAGRITRVSPVADPTTRQVQIIASIPNAGNRLVAGLFAEGRVAAESREAFVAPAAAIDQRGVTPSVVRVKNGRAEKVQVELGLADEGTERVEIRRGVQLGDTLLLGQAQGIAPNTPVRVRAVSDAPSAPTAATPTKQ
jgi:RND family efflux transporter MFP subunit